MDKLLDNTYQGYYIEMLSTPQWQAKRKRIIERDGYQCACCGATEHLNVHHKQIHFTPDGKRYAPWSYDDKYLITLCEECHSEGHRKYRVPTFTIY